MTSEEASDEHPFSIRSASDGTSREPGGKKGKTYIELQERDKEKGAELKSRALNEDDMRHMNLPRIDAILSLGLVGNGDP